MLLLFRAQLFYSTTPFVSLFRYFFTLGRNIRFKHIVIYPRKLINIIMRNSKKSKRLEAIISRTERLIKGDGITTSFSDRLVIELLGNETTTAHCVVRSLAGEHGIMVIMRRIVEGLISAPRKEHTEAQEHYSAMCSTLTHTLNPAKISTAHMLYAATYDSTTVTSRTLHSYGIKAEDILLSISTLQ